MIKNRTLSVKTYMILTFLVAFLPRFILCFFSYPADFLSDEVTTAASAATAYGFDWSHVLSTGRYYGQGFTILFTPLYFITNNPIIIFRTMNMIYALLQAFGALIAFHCFKKYFQINNYFYIAICSVGCSYLIETRATIISNEHPLLLICWITTWLLLILESSIDNKKKRAKYTIILVLILIYSLTLHTRAITLWIALGFCIIFYFWVYRKWIVSLPILAILGVIGIAIGRIVITYIQKTIWSVKDSSTLTNSYFNIDLSSIIKLFHVDSWQGWANIIIGQINTVYVVSCCMAIIGIVILFELFWKAFRRQPEIINSSNSTLLSRFVLIGSFFVVAVVVTIGGQSISWLPDVKDGMLQGFGCQSYSFKAFTYFRYFALYTGPLLMLTLAYIYLYSNKLMKYCKVATITVILLQAYFIICIVPYIYNFQEYVTTLFRPYIFFLTFGKTNMYTFLGSSFVLFVIWIVIWTCYHKKNIVAPALLVSSVLIYQYVALTIHYDYPKQRNRYAIVNASYSLMTELEENDSIPKEIYVIPRENNISTAPYFSYQFYLNHYTVSPWVPDASLSEGIAFHNEPDYEYLINLGYDCIQLDQNEYIYIKGDTLQNIIKNAINK